MSAYTLMLDNSWDITLTGDGKIKTTSGAYAIAQNASNAVRLFTNDAYFNARKGIPHFDVELGHGVSSVPVLETHMKRAMMEVEGVEDAIAIVTIEKNRIAGGNAYITLTDGETAKISF